MSKIKVAVHHKNHFDSENPLFKSLGKDRKDSKSTYKGMEYDVQFTNALRGPYCVYVEGELIKKNLKSAAEGVAEAKKYIDAGPHQDAFKVEMISISPSLEKEINEIAKSLKGKGDWMQMVPKGLSSAGKQEFQALSKKYGINSVLKNIRIK